MMDCLRRKVFGMNEVSVHELPAAIAAHQESGFFTVADLIGYLRQYPSDAEIVLDRLDEDELISLDEIWPVEVIDAGEDGYRTWLWGPMADDFPDAERHLKIRLA